MGLVVSPHRLTPATELSTEDTFQATVSNLLAIQSSLKRPSFQLPHLPPTAFVRVLGILLPPYWFIGRVLGANVIVATLGSIALCWQANWARKLADTLWKSAWFRFGVAYIWSIVSGSPRPSPPSNPKSSSQTVKHNSTELRLLFTIFGEFDTAILILT